MYKESLASIKTITAPVADLIYPQLVNTSIEAEWIQALEHLEQTF